MKISLTKEQLLTILTQKFGTEVTQVSLINPEARAKSVETFIARELKLNKPLRESELISQAFKIPAIKAIRSWHQIKFKDSMSLLHAKCAIEHWNKWFACYKVNGRLPIIDNHYAEGGPNFS